ncbi:hypothetical protein T4B_6462 [Trichinella pseudospiralis]|uniref:Uncharacterized protein n=1 Tax=Trichinella pseudospiralis TaxID=6337 RepID=A0A0V1I5A9_TRIPS|nr:hypothetical protein T4B_6462 [Trichinella pseudospiralis]
MLNSGAVIGGMMAKMQCMLKMKRKRLITKRKKQDKSNMFIEMNNHRQEADKTGGTIAAFFKSSIFCL